MKLNGTGWRISLVAWLAALLLTPTHASDLSLPRPLLDADYHPVDQARAELGQLLFYDRILSGNQNIACSTCHHPDHATSDGLSLPVGEGGEGLGPTRTVGSGHAMIEQRVPRNSQSLFNIGAREYTRMFFDGRVALDHEDPTGFNTPAEEDLPAGLGNVVAAQAMFPVTSHIEMAGTFGENVVANAANRAHEYVWPVIAERIRTVPAYVERFRNAFDDVEHATDITMVHVANALADFQIFEWRADDSPFDRYLRGDNSALSPNERAGMQLFYGEAECANCHAGILQTDHEFHAIAMPQLGWVRTRQFDFVARDQGRINESDRAEDRYRFRTPSLRNVAFTAPYGHSGAYPTLTTVIRHHLDPVRSLASYTPEDVVLPAHPVQSALDSIVMENARVRAAISRSNELAPMSLSEQEIDNLVAFLGALTDTGSLRGRLGIPSEVPSGLPVDHSRLAAGSLPPASP